MGADGDAGCVGISGGLDSGEDGGLSATSGAGESGGAGEGIEGNGDAGGGIDGGGECPFLSACACRGLKSCCNDPSFPLRPQGGETSVHMSSSVLSFCTAIFLWWGSAVAMHCVCYQLG